MKKNRRSDKNSGGWLSTYGDMVTLLLCFFVLLYSMSSIDESKWEIIVKSLNPSAEDITQIIDSEISSDDGEEASDNGENLLSENEIFDNLYFILKKWVEDNKLNNSIEISKGEGITFISFKNNIFFDGNSSILRDDGKFILDFFADAIKKVESSVGEIRILGHTNQAEPGVPNNVEVDRYLSSDRATRVLVYLQLKNLIDPKKMSSIGYGQHYPVAKFDTPSNRAKNRRVEIIIAKNGATNLALEYIYEQIGIKTVEVKPIK